MGISKGIKIGIQARGTGKAVGKGVSVKDKMTISGPPGFVSKAPKAKSLKGAKSTKQIADEFAKEIMQEIAFVGAPAVSVGMALDESAKKNKGKKIKKPKKKIPGLKGKK